MLLHSLSCRTLVFGGVVIIASCPVALEDILALRMFADFYEFVRSSSSLRVETLIDHEFSVRLWSFRYQDVHKVWL